MIKSIIWFGLSLLAVAKSDDGCWIWTDNQCDGDIIVTNSSFEANRWFTPARGTQGWQPSFQDYDRLVGFAHLTYSADLSSVTVEVVATHRDSSALTYNFNLNGTSRGSQEHTNIRACKNSSSTASFSTKDSGPLLITVAAADGAQLELEPVDFHWDAPAVSPAAGDVYKGGQKGAIVEFFGWPHKDIQKECAFLAEAGYMGAKFFPVQEQVMSSQPFQNDLNPWYFMYQPMSYRLGGRMGSRSELREAIHACREAGVRVYADAVINHMVGGGNDANPDHRDTGCTYWGAKNSSLSDGQSPTYTQCYSYTIGNYTQLPPSQEFPAVPYSPTDFHCERVLNSWTDPLDLNAGWLDGLVDLNTEKDYVQERIAAYLTDLISIGFSGIRVDAAKHIAPDDLVDIFTKFRTNMGGSLPTDFVAWLEVLLGGESDLLMCDPDSGYNYGSYLADGLSAAGFTDAEVEQVKIWNSGYPKEPESGYCTITASRNAIQNDDADQQTEGSTSRDMGDQGCVLIENCEPDEHRQFEVKLFDSPNGVSDNSVDYPIRLILSSYYWQGDSKGVPDGLSDCSLCEGDECDGCQTTEQWNAFNANSCGYDGEYTRPHRDISIVNAMRNWMGLSNLTYSDLRLTEC